MCMNVRVKITPQVLKCEADSHLEEYNDEATEDSLPIKPYQLTKQFEQLKEDDNGSNILQKILPLMRESMMIRKQTFEN